MRRSDPAEEKVAETLATFGFSRDEALLLLRLDDDAAALRAPAAARALVSRGLLEPDPRDPARLRASDGFLLLRGHGAALAQAERMVRDGSRSLRVVASDGASPLPGGAWGLFLARVEGGAEVRVICDLDSAVDGALAQAARLPNFDVRRLEMTRNVRLLLKDESESLAWVSEDVAIWSREPFFVAAQEDLFDTLWAAGSRRVDVRVPE